MKSELKTTGPRKMSATLVAGRTPPKTSSRLHLGFASTTPAARSRRRRARGRQLVKAQAARDRRLTDWWRTGINDSLPDFSGRTHAFNAISPGWWATSVLALDLVLQQRHVGDQADCNPTASTTCLRMPGDLSSGARFHGDFYWHHFYTWCAWAVRASTSRCRRVQRGQPDREDGRERVDAADQLRPPALDADGTACSSDTT